jgi:hypothetical protein
MAVYSPVSCGLSPKNYSTHPMLAIKWADIGAEIEETADERRLSNAGLDRSEHIIENVNGITDISDEEDTESTCENSRFNDHEATVHGLLT